VVVVVWCGAVWWDRGIIRCGSPQERIWHNSLYPPTPPNSIGDHNSTGACIVLCSAVPSLRESSDPPLVLFSLHAMVTTLLNESAAVGRG
jgi:hypothetical protein